MHEAHAGQHIYIRANGRVARELHYFREPLVALECVNIGHEGVTAEISTATTSHRLAVGGKETLESLLPTHFTGEVQISLYTETRLRATYFLYFVEKPRLESGALDKHVFELQLALESGQVPDWRSFESARDDPARSLFERDYMNGFYEYSLAFYLEKDGQASSSKFEKAMTLLSKFNTPFRAQLVMSSPFETIRSTHYTTVVRDRRFSCPEPSFSKGLSNCQSVRAGLRKVTLAFMLMGSRSGFSRSSERSMHAILRTWKTRWLYWAVPVWLAIRTMSTNFIFSWREPFESRGKA